MATTGGFKWTDAIPVYVSNEDADGRIWSYNVSAWISISVMFLLFINGFLWGLYGLYAFVDMLVRAVA